VSELDYIDKAKLIVETALERNAQDPVVLEIRELTSFADAFVLLSGGSDRQVRAIADQIEKKLKEVGSPPIGIEGSRQGRWVLLDCNEVVVHVFEPEVRELYALERLWSDAPVLDLELPTAPATTDTSGDTKGEPMTAPVPGANPSR
jgi:ribosome-associated protein